jgi:hypothetical protein
VIQTLPHAENNVSSMTNYNNMLHEHNHCLLKVFSDPLDSILFNSIAEPASMTMASGRLFQCRMGISTGGHVMFGLGAVS